MRKELTFAWLHILPAAKHCARSFMYIISFRPYNNSNKVGNGPILQLTKLIFLKIK